jgi:hypothetical protein
MITCPNCHTEYSEDNKFCIECGHVAPFNEVPEPVEVEDPNTTLMEQLTKLEEKKGHFESARVEIETEIVQRENFIRQIDAWEQGIASSFLAKTFKKMKNNMSEAQNLLSEYERIVNNLSIPDAGIMEKLRKRFHHQLLTTFTIVPLIMTILIWIPTWILTHLLDKGFALAGLGKHPGFTKFLNSLISYRTNIYLYGIAVMVVSLFTALTAYYRGWSAFQAAVNKALWELDSVVQGATIVRGEEIRLRSLYPQVKEWLEIIGHSLNRPWSVRPAWFESTQGTIVKESLPYSLHIAQAAEEDSGAMLGMQRYAAERFMARGWRARVFADQIDVIREFMNLPKERLNVEQLDQDISYSPNGPRAIVGGQITEQKILETVARHQMAPLILEVQREASGNARPRVQEVRASGSTSKQSSEDFESMKQWDEFLSMSIGDERRGDTPLSLGALSDDGQVAGHQGRPESFFILPQRLHGKLPNAKDENVRSYGESARLPMDIVVRVDMTGPIPEEHLAILARSKEAIAHEKAEASKKAKEKLKNQESGI